MPTLHDILVALKKATSFILVSTAFDDKTTKQEWIQSLAKKKEYEYKGKLVNKILKNKKWWECPIPKKENQRLGKK